MTLWSILRFQATQTSPPMTKAHFDEFSDSSSVKQSLPSVNHEQFPMQMTHKHNNWLQILALEDFPPQLLWSENADFKFSVNNEGDDVNKNRGGEGTSLSTAKATPTTRDRGTGDWNQRHYDRFTLSKTQIS